MSESPLAAAARVDAIAGSGEPFADRPVRPQLVKAREAGEAGAARGVAEVYAEMQTRADAQVMLGRAMERGGRNPLAVQATDSQALEALFAILMQVQRTKDDAPGAAMKTALERGEAIARAIFGDKDAA